MDLVRTTIAISSDLHTYLRLKALKEKKSLGELVMEKYRGKKMKSKKISVEEQIKRDFALFDMAAKTSVEYDAVKAVREDRDRDNA